MLGENQDFVDEIRLRVRVKVRVSVIRFRVRVRVRVSAIRVRIRVRVRVGAIRGRIRVRVWCQTLLQSSIGLVTNTITTQLEPRS